MNKAEKTQVIEELLEKLNANNKIYLADCSTLTVEKVNAFRKQCFEKKISITVVKNTLLKKALERANDSKLTELIPALTGETALMFTDTSNAPAKVIKEFRKKDTKPALKAAYVERADRRNYLIVTITYSACTWSPRKQRWRRRSRGLSC
jgi:large subunit ribosomal protein L10